MAELGNYFDRTDDQTAREMAQSIKSRVNALKNELAPESADMVALAKLTATCPELQKDIDKLSAIYKAIAEQGF